MAIIHYSLDKKYYYVTRAGDWPGCWLEVDKHDGEVPFEDRSPSFLQPLKVQLTNTKTGEVYWKKMLPFSEWKVKGGESHRLSERTEIFKDYASASGWKNEGRWLRILKEKWNRLTYVIDRWVAKSRFKLRY